MYGNGVLMTWKLRILRQDSPGPNILSTPRIRMKQNLATRHISLVKAEWTGAFMKENPSSVFYSECIYFYEKMGILSPSPPLQKKKKEKKKESETVS